MPQSLSLTILKSNLLYPFLFVGVLLLSGCTENSRGNKASEATEKVPTEEELLRRSDSDTGEIDRVASGSNQGQIKHYRILFVGDSITAGYGIDAEYAFPALIQSRINNLGLPFTVADAGFSGDTSAGGLSRISWLLRERVDILVLELGGNDGLRGVATDVTRENLSGIIEKTRATYPDVQIILAGMQVPPNLGHEYTSTFREIYHELSEEYNTALIPFILEGVGGNPELNQPDQIHPTAEGHSIVADNVWKVLQPMLIEFEVVTQEVKNAES